MSKWIRVSDTLTRLLQPKWRIHLTWLVITVWFNVANQISAAGDPFECEAFCFSLETRHHKLRDLKRRDLLNVRVAFEEDQHNPLAKFFVVLLNNLNSSIIPMNNGMTTEICYGLWRLLVLYIIHIPYMSRSQLYMHTSGSVGTRHFVHQSENNCSDCNHTPPMT